MSQFPDLPIITPDPPRKSQVEKYGGLLYLGAGGLAVLLILVAWFGFGVWSMRSVWTDIYLLNDPRIPEADRVEAATRLVRDPRVTDRQKWDLALSKTPPDLARYLMAESLSSEAAQADSRAYGLAVLKSEGWPDWLRVLLARPLAYSAGEGGNPDLGPIREMTHHADPFLALWAQFALVVSGTEEDRDAARRFLEVSAHTEGQTTLFARLLHDAAVSHQPARSRHLDEATRRLRRDHPSAAALWSQKLGTSLDSAQ